jgi:LysR family transcriptional regulator, low CO2-responsive transcriptional regulator
LKRHPNLQIVVTIGSGSDILNALLNFDLDVGVIAYKPLDPRFFVSFYKRFRLHIVANAEHPLAKRRSIRIEQLEGQRLIQRTTGVTRSVFNRALDKAGVTIRPVVETNSLEGVLAAIIQGIGLGVISDSGLTSVLGHHSLKVLPVTNADMFTDAYVVCLVERRERPLIASFLHCANEGAHKMSTGKNQ